MADVMSTYIKVNGETLFMCRVTPAGGSMDKVILLSHGVSKMI